LTLTTGQLNRGTLARVAGFVLVVIGVLVFLGSLARWASCPTTPCGGPFMAISDYSGIDLGFVWITALGGLALIAIGLGLEGRIS
jgi:hypothetical protein